ncbi:hypothetical protein NC653_028983 [Populus alba x Populus x berolinensis]|uniref:Transmembrane 9 superfamily member n=1 Tax=Populus alba x Populus x berolinensis TaxID=444605 RepID=A0AAD6M246_9ROSI|nr:hypothetical protein NC653_028983 [Populus alba x Populus x berolinensis]
MKVVDQSKFLSSIDELKPNGRADICYRIIVFTNASSVHLEWMSFLCGGSTGLFIYAYCFYYYYALTEMSGFMQTSFMFGYMAASLLGASLCWAL